MEVEKREEGEAAAASSGFGPWVAVRRPFRVDSPFFAAGNVERELLAKQISLEITEEEKKHIVQSEEEQLWQLFCPIAGCGIKLKGVGELESHYLSRHSATCSVCTRVFPTTRLLNLHVSETHDSFFLAKVARKYPMYECLVEGCPARFVSDSSRHQHLVDKHHFPRSFRFLVKKHASQKQRQRQKAHQPSGNPATPKQSKAKKSLKAKNVSQQQISEATTTSLEIQLPQSLAIQNSTGVQQIPQSDDRTQMDVDELATAVSRLSTVSQGAEDTPAELSFGHRRGRGLPFGPKPRGSGRGRGRGRSTNGRGNNEPPAAAQSSPAQS